ncbi:flagellar hook-length control protein FliK [Rhodoferax sp.]|uniref:flagellar hook-length control protein FliK n=1 Tax=Rhodoferax sp. TaxID=50421 RepID=UPI00260D4148|nr:flagellar hook-length control protein FliK [Rhodoferax sp.]MDD2808254.1 flagellar hook-length control protein FliK [Rhodoferax sp.]
MSIDIQTTPQTSKAHGSGATQSNSQGQVNAQAAGAGEFSFVSALSDATQGTATAVSVDDDSTAVAQADVDALLGASSLAPVLALPLVPESTLVGVQAPALAVGSDPGSDLATAMPLSTAGGLPVQMLTDPAPSNAAETSQSALATSLLAPALQANGFQPMATLNLAKNGAPSRAAPGTQETGVLSPKSEADRLLPFAASQISLGSADSTTPNAAGLSPVHELLAQRSSHQSFLSASVAKTQPELVNANFFTTGLSPVLSDAALSLGNGFDLVRPASRTNAKSGAGGIDPRGFEGMFGQATSSMNRADAVFQVTAPSAMVAEGAVAETVTYWASQGVQSAELTLDGFGDSPVEVSISLNGDQTQIEFRTDQAGVRQVLENATTQLKDMLTSQGLQLAGVTIGSSSAGGQSSGERRPKSGGQTTQVVQMQVLDAAVSSAHALEVGRSLDLFV